jgi:glycosyltransferase involved in cell wall biosynthesis
MKVSVVIPIFNERDNIPILYEKLRSVIEKLKDYEWEIVFADNASTDGSFEILKEIHKKDKRVKVIRLRRNFGQTGSLAAGLDFATGDIIITMDGDLQNDPEDIPLFLEKIQEGYDIVSGWRYNRKDPITKKIPSKIYNWLASRLTGVKIHDFGCTFKAMRKEVVKNIKLYGEMHRYIEALASEMGVSIAEIKVRHHPRIYGKSKYGISRIIKGFLDLLTVKFLLSYSTRPLHLFGIPGLILTLLGILTGGYLTFKWFMGESIWGRPLLLLVILLIIVGVQFIVMGLLAEMIMRTYYESTGKKIYYVKEVLD